MWKLAREERCRIERRIYADLLGQKKLAAELYLTVCTEYRGISRKFLVGRRSDATWQMGLPPFPSTIVGDVVFGKFVNSQ